MYNNRTKIKDVLDTETINFEATVMGWVRTFRNNQFIAMNDGTTNRTLQVVAPLGQFDDLLLKRLNTGACIKVIGEVVLSRGTQQAVEMIASSIEILGDCDSDLYPLQPKRHTYEFLRDIAHLRFRTNTFGSIFRVRHSLAFAVHKFFNERGFVYINTPIITASDAEGAGEMFRVTTLPLDGTAPKLDDGSVNFKEDFFGKSTNLTVSGQLEGELAALALGEIYTFGPTFRAENSNTSRHLAEFWMIEPEVAFADLEDNMNLAEDFIKYIITHVMQNNQEDMLSLARRYEEEERTRPLMERSLMGLLEKLTFVGQNKFERITYTEAISILRESNHNKKKKFKYPIEEWGMDLQSEHERFLVEKHFKKPVIITDYPKGIKSFYMRVNDDDKTVAAMDILVPGIGELVGGSQREERIDKLEARMKELNIPAEELDWYLDTRRYGTAPHSGFGLGFERMVQFVTGMSNIRDVIPFPRFPNNADF